jgi:hypothetical protein
MTYQHKEAFALMWYECACGHRERIWNSRDGVTPFGISCPSCGGYELHHVAWNLDDCQPDFKPHRGQRYFASGTADEAVAIIEARFKHAKEHHGHDVPPHVAEALRKAARDQADEWSPGWPIIHRMADSWSVSQ